MNLSFIIFTIGIVTAIRDGKVSETGFLPSFSVLVPYIQGQKKISEMDLWTLLWLICMSLIATAYICTRLFMNIFEQTK